MDAGIVQVPFSTQLLAAAMALQAFAFAVMVWRAFLGRPERFRQRPRWPLIPLVLGTAAGVWYAVIQRDLVMGAAQALALFVGFKLILGAGPARSGEPAPQGTRRERRAAAREAKRKGRADG
jgi:hypothetical protein